MRPQGIGSLLAGVTAILVASVFVVVILPASDADLRRPSARACAQHPNECTTLVLIGDTLTPVPPDDPRGAAERNATSSWARGRDLYIREGCFYCHTQDVRPVLADVGLGPVTNSGDAVFQDPPLLGSRRVGPDLANVGTRPPFDSCDGVRSYLRDPRSLYPWSRSPTFRSLPDVDLTDLATYVTSLRPAGARGPASCDPLEAPPVTPTAGASVTPTVSA